MYSRMKVITEQSNALNSGAAPVYYYFSGTQRVP